MIGPFSLNAIGLVCDTIGAAILGFSLALTTIRNLYHQSETYWDASLPLFRALVLQRYDARVGLAFLVSGFSGQFLDAIGLSLWKWAAIGLYAAIPILLLAYLVGRRSVNRNSEHRFSRLSEEGVAADRGPLARP